MKNVKLILSVICAVIVTTASAQYGQRTYYTDTITNESFQKGIISYGNLYNGFPSYVGTGFVNTGTTAVPSRARLTRTQQGGTTIFNRIYYIFKGAEMSAHSNSVADGANQLVIAGAVQHSTAIPGGSDILIMKTSATGIPATPRRIDLGGAFDEALCTINSRFNATKYLTCGYTASNGISRVFVMKHNNTGTVINWVRYFNLPCAAGANGNARANFLVDDPATGNIYVVGTINTTAAGCRSSFILKISQAGVYQWLYIYTFPNGTGVEFNSIKPTEAANFFIIAGTVGNPGALGNRALLMRVDVNGAAPFTVFSNMLFTNGPTPNFPIAQQTGLDVCTRLKTTSVEYFLCGATTYTFGSTDGHIFKCNSAGNPLSGMLYNWPFNDELRSINSHKLTDSVAIGLAAFGKYTAGSAAAGVFARSWLLKSYYNLVTGCADLPDTLYRTPIILSKAYYQPFMYTAYTNDSLTVQHGKVSEKKLCWANVVAGGSNARMENDMQSPQAGDLKLFPNPLAGNELTIELNSQTDEVAKVTIYNAIGQTVESFNVELSQGVNLIRAEINENKKGMYIVEVSGSQKTYRSRLIRQ